MSHRPPSDKNSSRKGSNLMQQVEERVKEIDYDFSRFTIPGFTQWISSRCGIEIHLEPSDELQNPPGFWFLSDDGAHVKYRSRLPKTLEIITILHELMHIYLGHKTLYVPRAMCSLLKYYPGIAARDPSQQSIDEKEAEIAAVLIYERLRLDNDPDPISNFFRKLEVR